MSVFLSKILVFVMPFLTCIFVQVDWSSDREVCVLCECACVLWEDGTADFRAYSWWSGSVHRPPPRWYEMGLSRKVKLKTT